ncbi:CBS domain-containing protein [Streptomyces sp. NPDC008092]|uniref:CBS domain-containing protein n=1 Tax=Streptomyces sp. NPDC008092 TaxID=3364808 RepID=UPI0036E02120
MTIRAKATPAEAARTMARKKVERLPVVDEHGLSQIRRAIVPYLFPPPDSEFGGGRARRCHHAQGQDRRQIPRTRGRAARSSCRGRGGCRVPRAPEGGLARL